MSERSLTLSVAEETAAGLDRLAHETGRSADQLVEEALQRFLDYESWKMAKIQHAIARADAGEFASEAEMDEAFDRYRYRPRSGMRIRFSAPARQDLIEIQDYIARDDAAAAYRVAQRIRTQVGRLAQHRGADHRSCPPALATLSI